MLSVVDELLDAVEVEIVLGSAELSKSLFEQFRARPPSPARFGRFVERVDVQAPMQGRLELARLALDLVPLDPGYRRIVEREIREAGFDRQHLASITTLARRLSGQDLLWWYDVFVRDVGGSGAHDTLLVEHGPFLLANRRDAVVRMLLGEPGPGGYVVESCARVIQELGGCRELEQRVVEWIRGGMLDRARPGAAWAAVLVVFLAGMAERGVSAGERLMGELVAHWAAVLDGAAADSSGDLDRRRVVRDVWDVLDCAAIEAGRIVAADLVLVAPFRDLLPVAVRVGLREAGAIRAAMISAYWFVRRGSDASRDEQRRAYAELYRQMSKNEYEVADLPWPKDPSWGDG